MRRRVWIASVLLAGVAGVAGGLAVLLETGAGLHWALALAERHSGGALSFTSAQGRLAGPFTVTDLRLRLADSTLRVRTLRLDWNPSALVLGKVHVVSLLAQGLDVTLPAAGSGSAGVTLPARLSLPLAVRIDSLQARDVRVHRGSRRFACSRIGLRLAASDSRIALHDLAVDSARLSVRGNLAARPRGTWPLSLHLDWTLALPDRPTLAGKTRIDGALRRRLQLHQTVTGGLDLDLTAKAQNLFTSLRWSAHLQLNRVDLQAWRKTWPAVAGSASLALDGGLHRLQVHGEVRLSKPRALPLSVAVDVSYRAQQLAIHQLQVGLVDAPARVAADGMLEFAAGAPRAQLALSWRDIAWPLGASAPSVSAPAGDARLQGTLHQWRLDAQTRLAAAGLAPGTWQISAAGGGDRIEIERLAGRWLGGTVQARGDFALTAPRRFQLTGRAEGMHVDALAAGWRGQASLAFAAAGALAPLSAQLRLTNVRGRINDRPLGGKATLRYSARTLEIASAEVSLGPNRLSAHGRWGTRLDLAWTLAAPALDAFGYGLGGKAEASGSVLGTPQHPEARGTITLGDFRWNDLSVQTGRIDFAGALAPQAPVSADVALGGVQRGGLALDHLSAALQGPADAERLVLQADGGWGRFDLAAAGARGASGWSGHVTAAQIAPKDAPAFRLQAPAQVFVGSRRLALQRACLADAAGARLCAAATSDPQRWTVAAELEGLPLAVLDPFLPDGFQATGRLDAALEGAGGGGHLSARLTASAASASVSREVAGERRKLRFARLAVAGRLGEATASLEADAALAAGGTLKATARIPWRTHAEPAGELHLVAHVPDLSPLDALSTQVLDVAGRLDADLDLTGNLSSPKLRGSLQVSDAALTVAQTGTRISGGELRLRGTTSGVRFDAAAHDGGSGRMTLEGSAQERDGTWNLAADVKGRDFLAADMPEARVRVTPDLQVALHGHSIDVGGTVTIPWARLQPPEFAGAVAPTPDLVVAGQEKPASRSRWRLAADVAIRLGNDVQFAGYGLTATIGGSLRVKDQPDKLTTASGELNLVKGQYKAYGQNLTIERGRLLFSGGPVTNPGLDIRATRTVGFVVAGLDVTGTLRNPKLEVFSNPPMSQSDALAYLLFGHGMSQASGSEQSTFARAANAIGIAGGTYVAKALGEHLGVDTVSVENASDYSTASNQASLFLGKYLSPRLYVSYGIGLFAPINLFRVRYTLSRHWALEAESGTISGADILYNIEH